MTCPKERKNQMYTGSSSAILSRKMDESSSLSGESKCTSVCSNEQPHLPPKTSQIKKPVILPDSDIDGLLECPVCSNAMFPPIQQVCTFF